MLTMLDLCSGLGGASAAMVDRPVWHVTRLDNDPAFTPDIVADVREWQPDRVYDFIWFSPPCTEFSRESMPWCRTGHAPDMSIVQAGWQIITTMQPRRGYVIENVRGAVLWFAPLMGRYRQRVGPFYLWHNLPLLTVNMLDYKKKESYPSTQPAQRAKVPYALSESVAWMVERQNRFQEAA